MTAFAFTRRGLLGGLAAASAFAMTRAACADDMLKDVSKLKPGDFTWNPEREPSGPVSVVVSIPEQRVHVYRNGVRIAVATCSTGKPGHETPTGVFVVLQKDKNHHSSIYDDAPMPNMNRLTWSGVALHAGNLPGYPASHGCVRLPTKFSELLFTVTHVGTPVIIAGAHTDPWELTHPGMVLSGYAENEFEHVLASLDGKKHPSDWSEAEQKPVTSVIVSSADKVIELIENDRVVARSKLTLKDGDKLGSHVFVLNGANTDARGMHWSAITHQQATTPLMRDDVVMQRISAEPAFVNEMKARMHPGMTMVLTDAPLTPDTKTGKDFVIVTAG
ncbi:L,D-transpeptidase [Methylocystis parvus]|uniref:L,D-transpeptidase n=1 Tax=Methylocystis parvus TaxID=134 RepID=A0A6B8MAR9_9HYPH|nr:L,D-transpeptidase [Methylocystis parvus]QGM98669.1 L,D-transpeptidase [Methylocystis parvus]WBK00983.1 L,D-transpeptidase [Methylocystis parvus OBBP]